MVATIPKSSSPTHDLAARLHRKVAKPTDVELKTALVLQDASHCGSFVVANITSIAETIGTTRTQVMRAIKRMRRVGLIGAEFTGVGEMHVAGEEVADREFVGGRKCAVVHVRLPIRCRFRLRGASSRNSRLPAWP